MANSKLWGTTASSNTTPTTPTTPTDPSWTNPTDPGGWLYSGNKKDLYAAYGFKDSSNLQRDMAKRLSVGMWPRMAQEVSFSNSLEPLRQNAVNQLLTALNPANLQATFDSYNRKTNANAVENARLADLMMRQSGMGSGALQGAQLNAANNAQSSANSYLANLLSPEGLQNTIGKYLSSLSTYQQMPSMSQFMQLATGTPPAQPKTDGWGNLLSTAATVLPFFL